MPYLVLDYSRCDGDGACISSCPGSVFELSSNGRWCKPTDNSVKNSIALKSFSERILSSDRPVNLAIRYHVPDCYLCWQCIGACPKKAIDVEYDDLDIREHLLIVSG
jgi:NAD-dependent dihydropyrimidine dehydrogenase PreA subunit